MKLKSIFLVSILTFIFGIFGYSLNKEEKSKIPKHTSDTIQVENTWIDTVCFKDKHPSESLMDALLYYEVKHPEIVYAQAILETGHFKSNLCINHNNLFGLYNSRKQEFYTFNHWTDSIEAYIKYIQYRYIPPNDYYEFLDNIGYAEDPNYINKLKKIVNKSK